MGARARLRWLADGLSKSPTGVDSAPITKAQPQSGIPLLHGGSRYLFGSIISRGKRYHKSQVGKSGVPDVRFGSEADVRRVSPYVRLISLQNSPTRRRLTR